MKCKILTIILCCLATTANANNAKELEITKSTQTAMDRTRAKITGVKLQIEDKMTGLNEMVTLGFCTGDAYEGVQGVYWGPDAIAAKRREKCALGAASCNAFDAMWNGDATPHQPRKPTMMLEYGRAATPKRVLNRAHKVGVAELPAKENEPAEYDGMYFVTFPDGMTLATVCGGGAHP